MQFDGNRETFRAVSGYPNYEISSHGRIRNVKSGRILKQAQDSNGYMRISLSFDNKSRMMSIHRLVAINFLDNIDDKSCVDHKDNDKSNNSVDNLRFATYSENNMNRIKQSKNKYKGIVKRGNRWRSRITHDGKDMWLGTYDTEQEAAIVYNIKALELFGEFANLNIVTWPDDIDNIYQ